MVPVFRGESLTVCCVDLEQTTQFYQKILGATPVPSELGIATRLQLGRITLNLLPNAELPSPATFPEHAMPMLWLETDDLELAHKWFEDQGVNIIDPGDGQFMQISDPDGIVIEVWQTP